MLSALRGHIHLRWTHINHEANKTRLTNCLFALRNSHTDGMLVLARQCSFLTWRAHHTQMGPVSMESEWRRRRIGLRARCRHVQVDCGKVTAPCTVRRRAHPAFLFVGKESLSECHILYLGHQVIIKS